MLATAILQYYTTPWLGRSWCSGDILFFDRDLDPSHNKMPMILYLNAKVTRREVARPSPVVARQPFPNESLFCLGVVLLELAYKAPLLTPRKPCDLENDQETRHWEFYTARRLATNVSSDMGIT